MATFTKSKLFVHIKDPKVKGKKKKKKRKSFSFMARWLRLGGTRIGGGGAMVVASFYSTKSGREAIRSRNLGASRAVEKWQGYLAGNYRFYWSQVWDPHRAGKEATFIWSIWHKVVAVNKLEG